MLHVDYSKKFGRDPRHNSYFTAASGIATVAADVSPVGGKAFYLLRQAVRKTVPVLRGLLLSGAESNQRHRGFRKAAHGEEENMFAALTAFAVPPEDATAYMCTSSG